MGLPTEREQPRRGDVDLPEGRFRTKLPNVPLAGGSNAARFRVVQPRTVHAASGGQLGTLPGSAVPDDEPFHRFGVTNKIKDETKRDRRVGLQEERALLAASSQMSGPEHKYVGPLMHDRLIGALETCCRKSEMLRVQNRHVDWEHHQIAIPGRHANRCLPQPLDWRDHHSDE